MKKLLLTLVSAICCLFTVAAEPDYTQVYLIGGAAPNGWDNQKAEKMTLVENSDAVFTWTGYLKASDFKFLNALGSWDNCFQATSENETVILNQSHSIVFNNPDGDYKFKITEAGKYTVTADLKNLTMTVTAEQSDLPTELWITGSAVPGGTQKLVNAINSFKYYGALSEGEVKFMTTATVTADTRYVVPQSEDIDVVNSGAKIIYTTDATVPGWGVSFEEDTYRIDVNLFTNIEKGELFTSWNELYIIGGCVDGGWALETCKPFTQDATDKNVFTWTGELKDRTVDGETSEPKWFKLLGQRAWGDKSLHPLTAGESVLKSTQCNEDGGSDYKWSIEEDGTYTIKVNVFYQTIEASYKSPTGISVNTMEDVTVTATNGTIYINAGETMDAITVYDVNGKTISVVGNCQSGVVAEGLPHGLYIVKVANKQNSVVKKVVL